MIWTVKQLGHIPAIGQGLFTKTHIQNPKGVEWERWDCSSFKLGHAASLRILEGLALQYLFGADCYFQHEEEVVNGPFLLLNASRWNVWEPARLTKLTLGKVIHSNLRLDETLGILIESALSA